MIRPSERTISVVQTNRAYRGRRAVRWFSVIILFIVPVALFLALSWAYSHPLPALTDRQNLWFGADIPRFSKNWMAGQWFRAHLHPAVAFLFVAYGRVLSALGIDATRLPLPILALPVAVATSAATVFCVRTLPNSGEVSSQKWLLLVSALVIGPCLLFAPIPESHVLGGAALLAQGTLVFDTLRAGADGNRFRAIAVVVFGALAAACTVTNIVPAFFLLLTLLPRIGAGKVLAGSLVMTLLVVASSFLAWIGNNDVSLGAEIQFERFFIRPPSVGSLVESFNNLVVKQFGIPRIEAGTNSDPIDPVFGLVVASGPPRLSIYAALLWWVGISWWSTGDRATRQQRLFVAACVAGIAWIVGLHGAYGTHECYLYSPNAWPLVLLPGLAALSSDRARRYGPSIALKASVLLSCLQSAMGAKSLHSALQAVVEVIETGGMSLSLSICCPGVGAG